MPGLQQEGSLYCWEGIYNHSRTTYTHTSAYTCIHSIVTYTIIFLTLYFPRCRAVPSTALHRLLSCRCWSLTVWPAATLSPTSPGLPTTLEWLSEHTRSTLSLSHCTNFYTCVHAIPTCTQANSYQACVCISHFQAAIHMTDPLHLSACSLLSAHGNSPIVGLDVLTPGSEHIVVCVCVCVCLYTFSMQLYRCYCSPSLPLHRRAGWMVPYRCGA